MQQFFIKLCTIHFMLYYTKVKTSVLQYFIICKKAFDEALCFPDIQQAIRQSCTNLSLLMSELCSFLCLKLYSCTGIRYAKLFETAKSMFKS